MAPSARRLIVLDVDGTLLDSRLRIPAATRRAVPVLLAAGHRLVLASARPPRSVLALAQTLLGDGAAEMIALNGALVTRGRETLAERPIGPSTVADLVGHVRRSGLAASLYARWEWLVEEEGPEIRAEAAIVGFGPRRVDDLAALGSPAHKLLAIGAGAPAFRDRVRGGVEVSLSKPGYCEVVAAGASKAEAVALVRRALGVPAENVIAFGDAENDVPMLEAAGVAVAMGNAVEAVKRAADLVTGSNDEDGVALALVRLGLIENVCARREDDGWP
jgi:Cof subfamily protein (haloacid dehalogenase superfamily)